MRSRRFPLGALLPFLLLPGCGGGSAPPPPPPPPPTVTVSISPTRATVKAASQITFLAIVHGTSNTAVTWQVNGTSGGNAISGTIDTSGLYTAPSVVPSPATVTVTAILQADSTKSASASVTITVGVTVSPAQASLNISDSQCTATQQFNATVTGTNNSGVNWAVNGIPPGGANTAFGTVTTTGLYTSPMAIPDPSSFSVTATSQADATQLGGATVSISAGGASVNEASQPAPVRLGTSGGNANDETPGVACCSGTLGSLVMRNGANFILSNNHVLARTGKAAPGEPISQPGLVDSSCSPGKTVANFTQAVKLSPGGTSVADAALAQVAVVGGVDQVDRTGAILQLGPVSCGLAQPAPPASTIIAPAIGMPVAKSGRTTGLTCSTITTINGTFQVDYGTSCGSSSTFTVTYNNQVEIDSSTFSAAGDSGSLIVDAQTAQPTALLFAGDSTSASTIANPIPTVLANLPDTSNPPHFPTFVGGPTHTVAACTGFFASGATAQTAATAVRPLADEEIARATAAKGNHAAALLSDPAVIGVGVGAGDTLGEAAVIVFVDREKSHHPIPATLDGVKTKVKSVGRFRAFDAPSCSSKDQVGAAPVWLP